VITTFLELSHRPALSVTPAYRSGTLLRADEIGPGFYRYLCESSGRPGVWRERADLSDEAITEALARSEITVLYLGGVPSGWFELIPGGDDVEVAFVGVLPEFAGRALERPLLAAALDAAWDHEPERIWAQVTQDDPPGTLLSLQWAGFEVVDGPGDPAGD
jgi:GNAT superfamily N-acetyltransferase